MRGVCRGSASHAPAVTHTYRSLSRDSDANDVGSRRNCDGALSYCGKRPSSGGPESSEANEVDKKAGV